MGRLAALVLVLGACDAVFRFQDVPYVDGAGPDASCAFSRLVDTCSFGDPADWQSDVEIADGTQDPTIFVNSRTPDSPTGMLHVVLVKKLTVQGGSTLNIVAGKAFVIVADGDITILGTIHTKAGLRTRVDCATAAGARGSDDSGGASGGGGGAFGAAGGQGGSGDFDGLKLTGGIGGIAVELPNGLLAGCPGGPGGDATGGSGAQGGTGGEGGGAIALISRTKITVMASGLITAPGGGGDGGLGSSGTYSTGGGGGGAGGMIWLEAPQVIVDGALAANGGGGGEGAAGGDGMPGADASGGDTAAAGGTGAPMGGDGGSGGHAARPAGTASTDFLNGGGGGGGGGVGFIVIVSAMPQIGSASLSPQPTPAP